MSDPASQTIKEGTVEATNQSPNDGNDFLGLDSHEELFGKVEDGEHSVRDAQQSLSNIKQDGELIEKNDQEEEANGTPDHLKELLQLEQEPLKEQQPKKEPKLLNEEEEEPKEEEPMMELLKEVKDQESLEEASEQLEEMQVKKKELEKPPKAELEQACKTELEQPPEMQKPAEHQQNAAEHLEDFEQPNHIWLVLTVAAAVLGILLYNWPFHGTNIPDSRSVLQVFQKEFESLKNTFPEQTRDLWLRSGKMLQNHLNKAHPREPATIILTAGQDAKNTLLCLGGGLAQAYSVALDAKWFVIDGPSEARYDSGTAKLHIDQHLSSGFESNARAAVLSRLETLPSGSLLILYKYCDHENAAYKNVTLVLTVLLNEPSLKPDTPLPELEEKVRDFLYRRFITLSGIRSHNEMDPDKLSGVWSRISHLVLPVHPVASIETGSCPLKN